MHIHILCTLQKEEPISFSKYTLKSRVDERNCLDVLHIQKIFLRLWIHNVWVLDLKNGVIQGGEAQKGFGVFPNVFKIAVEKLNVDFSKVGRVDVSLQSWVSVSRRIRCHLNSDMFKLIELDDFVMRHAVLQGLNLNQILILQLCWVSVKINVMQSKVLWTSKLNQWLSQELSPMRPLKPNLLKKNSSIQSGFWVIATRL